MTRFRPAYESLDARTLPSAVVPAPAGDEPALIGLLNPSDPAAGDDLIATYDLKALKKVAEEPAGTHALYQDVTIPAGVGYDHAVGGGTLAAPPGDDAAGRLPNQPIKYIVRADCSQADPADPDADLPGFGIAVDVADPAAGMLLPAVQKVREAAAR